MHIPIFVAGTNNPSNSYYLSQQWAKQLQELGAESEVFRITDYNFDHFTVEMYEEDYQHSPAVKQLEQNMMRADGFIVATPVWNFGVPANMSNFMDIMGVFALDKEKRRYGQLKNKPFYLLVTGGAPHPAWHFVYRKCLACFHFGLQYFGAVHAGSMFKGRCTPRGGGFGLVLDKDKTLPALIAPQANRFYNDVKTLKETGQLPLRLKLWRKWEKLQEWTFINIISKVWK
jgi:multimeric flavodoxin WrbA